MHDAAPWYEKLLVYPSSDL